jgi:hypothetical protein
MNKDRGTIKWTAMMLPEHVQLLREWQQEDQFIKRPQLDEAQLEQIDSHIQRAYQENKSIQLKIWESTAMYEVEGTIHKVNAYEQWVQLNNGKKYALNSICETSIEGE